MITEFMLNKIPMYGHVLSFTYAAFRSLNHVWVFMLWPCAYILFSLIVFPVSHEWPYPILNAWVPLGVMWYTAFYIANILIFCACHGLHKLKLRYYGVTDWDGSGEELSQNIVANSEETPIFSDF